LLNPF